MAGKKRSPKDQLVPRTSGDNLEKVAQPLPSFDELTGGMITETTSIITDFQRQFFSEFQILFQPGVGLSGLTSSSYAPTNGVAGVGVAGVAIAGQSSIATQGANPQAMLRWSNDGGSTWSNEHWTSIGQQGRYNNRAIWRRLGQARDRVYEVVVTDPIKAVIVAANLKAEAGDN